MPLADIIGFSDAKTRLENCEAFVRKYESWSRSNEFLLDGLQSLPGARSNAGIANYLVGKLDRAAAHAGGVLCAANDYYFGDWRAKVQTDEQRIDPKWWHDKETWMHIFRASLCWGSVLGEWKTLHELAKYPDKARAIDTIDAKPSQRQLLLCISNYLRGEKVRGVVKECQQLPGFEWRGIGVLAAALDAITQSDSRAAQIALTEFFTKHHERKRSTDINDTVTLDGTFMLNLAIESKLKVDLPEELKIYHIRLDNPKRA